jgi:hypothetical protein
MRADVLIANEPARSLSAPRTRGEPHETQRCPQPAGRRGGVVARWHANTAIVLLRPRGEGPCRHNAAEKRDELTSPHCRTQVQGPVLGLLWSWLIQKNGLVADTMRLLTLNRAGNFILATLRDVRLPRYALPSFALGVDV